jgi:hypothetical protein
MARRVPLMERQLIWVVASSCILSGCQGVSDDDLVASVASNLASDGQGYRWYNNSSSTGVLNQTAASWVHDGSLVTNWVGNGGNNNDKSWEGVGIIWSSPQTLSAVTFQNGSNTGSADNCFYDVAGSMVLQQTSDGSTWTNVPDCTVSPQYPYNVSACARSGVNYTFHCPIGNVRGVRVFGQVGVRTSWDVTATELIVTGSSSAGPNSDLASSSPHDLAVAPDDLATGGGLAGRAIPAPVYGVTLDDVSNVSAELLSLKSLAHMPTTRIVFDLSQAASSYLSPVQELRAASYLMGEILDSSDMKSVTVSQAQQRSQSYVSTLGSNVDLWEIGNEVNGDWLGSNTMAKIEAMFDSVVAANGATALTFFYEGEPSDRSNCISTANGGNDMFTWINQNFQLSLAPSQRSAESEKLRTGLNYVLISWYPDQCPGENPNWTWVYNTLANIFPQAKLGFGELGTANPQNGSSYEVNEIDTYYPLAKNLSLPAQYIGGYFWWYYAEEMVPSTSALFSTLNNAIK